MPITYLVYDLSETRTGTLSVPTTCLHTMWRHIVFG